MKHKMQIIAAVVVVLCAWSTIEAKASNWQAGFEVRAVQDFYEPLSATGYWVETPDYGWCWYPAYVASDWRPYSVGHWEWTNQGWYWVSDEPWAWACYHYGRWTWHDYYGWLWVPGVEWAPAWVSWHEGGGYIGWAPLSPRCVFDNSGFISFRYATIHPRAYIFIEYHRFCSPIYPAIIIHHTHVHRHIIHKTVNVTNIKVVNKTVINEGPSVAQIEKNASQKITMRPVEEVRKEDAIRQARIQNARPSLAANSNRARESVNRDTTPTKPFRPDRDDRSPRSEIPSKAPPTPMQRENSSDDRERSVRRDTPPSRDTAPANVDNNRGPNPETPPMRAINPAARVNPPSTPPHRPNTEVQPAKPPPSPMERQAPAIERQPNRSPQVTQPYRPSPQVEPQRDRSAQPPQIRSIYPAANPPTNVRAGPPARYNAPPTAPQPGPGNVMRNPPSPTHPAPARSRQTTPPSQEINTQIAKDYDTLAPRESFRDGRASTQRAPSWNR